MGEFSFDTFLAYLRERTSLLDGAKPISFAKGEAVFRQGDPCPDIFVMTRGLVKFHYLTHDGKEWIKSFIADKGMLGSRVSQALGGPASFSAVCLEDTVVYPLSYQAFEAQCGTDPDLALMVFKFFQWLGVRKEQREHALLCRSAEERYTDFMSENAALAARITQADLARFLGITPIGLSRIKNRQSDA